MSLKSNINNNWILIKNNNNPINNEKIPNIIQIIDNIVLLLAIANINNPIKNI